MDSDSLWQRFCVCPFSSRAPLHPSRPPTLTQMHTCSGIMFATPQQPLPCLKSRRLFFHRLGMSTKTLTRGHAKINRRLFPEMVRDRPSCPHSKTALLPIFKTPLLGPYDQVQRVSVRTHARRTSARCIRETGRAHDTRARAHTHTHFARMHMPRQAAIPWRMCATQTLEHTHTHTRTYTPEDTHTHTHTGPKAIG
jgi:hypothetical protein